MDQVGSSPGSAGSGAPDPTTVTTKAEFAVQLGRLRIRAGVPLRQLAADLDVPASTVNGWMTGRHLPNLRQLDLLRRLLERLGLDANDQASWVEALHRVRRAPGPRPAEDAAPYRGLEVFDIDDAEWFFGRSTVLDEALNRLADLGRSEPVPADAAAVLVVVGPSGSGKSSLARAGIAASVAAGRGGPARPVAVCTPGADPVGSLVAALAAACDLSADAAAGLAAQLPQGTVDALPTVRPLVVVDQLEELFTVVTDESVRSQFLGVLLRIASPGNGVPVVVTLRADYYGHLLAVDGWAPLLQTQQLALGPMSAPELRSAIVEPARRAAVAVEPELVDVLLRDFAPERAGTTDAGALPLLGHALLQTWRRARRGEMTVGDYLAAGGLRGSVETTAEEAFGALGTDRQVLAKDLLLRLVTVDPDGRVARRPLPLDDLGPDEAALEPIVLHFVEARLLTIDESSVTLSHEALLDAWPRLGRWVDDEREGLLLRRRLEDAAAQWHASGADPNLLARGGRLEQFEGWLAGPQAARWAGAGERAFVAASTARVRAEASAARRRRRALGALTTAAVVLAVAALLSAVLAVRARDDANDERNVARSRRISLQADRLRNNDPALAAQLALAAYRTAPTVEARSALLDSTAVATPTRLLGGSGSTALAVAPDGRRLAFSNAADGTVQLVALDGAGLPARTETLRLAKSDDQAYALAFSPDGGLLVAGGSWKGAALWALDGTGARPLPPLEVASVQSLAFRPSSRELAVGGGAKTVARFDLTVPDRPAALAPTPGPEVTKAVTYSADGRLLAAGGNDGGVRVYDLSGATPTLVGQNVPEAGGDEANAVAFHPGGSQLAVGYRRGRVVVFPMSASGLGEPTGPSTTFTTWVNTLTYNADGSELTAGSSDTTVRSWRSRDWAERRKLSTTAPVTGVRYADDGRALATVSTDGTLRLYRLDRSPMTGGNGSVYGVAFNGDGSRLAVFPGRTTPHLWDTASLPAVRRITDAIPLEAKVRPTGVGALLPDGRTAIAGTSAGPSVVFDLTDTAKPRQVPTLLEGPTDLIETVASSADGRLVAVGSDDATIHLWDVSTPTAPRKLDIVLKATSLVMSVAFDRTGRLLAAGSVDKLVYLWDIGDPAAPKQLATLEGFESYAQSVAFSDDGKLLAAGGADSTVLVWDVTVPASPRVLGAPITGPQNYVYALAFRPGTRQLAGVAENVAWLWDLAEPVRPTVLAKLNASTSTLYSVTFSPDGRFLVAGSTDGSAFVWTVDVDTARRSLCTSRGDALTDKEWDLYLNDVDRREFCSP
jgi:WD40 repeat protein